MKETRKSAIINASIAGSFSCIAVLFSYWLNNRTERKIAELNAVVFASKIEIEYPKLDAMVPQKLEAVRGRIIGLLPDRSKIVVGHRESAEQEIKIHVDRTAEITQDKTFKVDDIYLGSKEQGSGKVFEILVLLMDEREVALLALKDGDNPLLKLPEHIAKSVIRVRRTR